MLYSEFVEGTGCKDTEYNHKIYKRLELMYMADDSITKQEIYEYGKKLVDNSKTPAEIEFENNIKSQIADFKKAIDDYRADIKRYEFYLGAETDTTWIKQWKDNIKWRKHEIAYFREKIRSLKWVLGT